MPRLGLNQKVVYAHNPLPAVDADDILLRAGLENMSPRKNMDFNYYWQYSGGDEREDVYVAPGEFVPLRETEAAQFYRDMYELGLVVVPTNDKNDPAVRSAVKAGLERALRYWQDRGARKITEWRRRAKVTDQELEAHRYDTLLWYHVAQAKADIIAETLRPSPKKLAAA